MELELKMIIAGGVVLMAMVIIAMVVQHILFGCPVCHAPISCASTSCECIGGVVK